jgi:uncharacterized membrane protein
LTQKFTDDFRRFFFRGLAAVLPTILTIVLIIWLFDQVQKYCGNPINHGLKYVCTHFWVWYNSALHDAKLSFREVEQSISRFWDTYLFPLGFVLAIAGIYMIGKFLASFMGRFVWKVLEEALKRLPFVSQVYSSIKQVTDFLLSDQKMRYSRVVAVEYPRKGMWSLGLATSEAMKVLDNTLEGEMMTVFIPSSPTPVTGYTVTVRRDEVIEMPLSIEEALQFTISGGVILPRSQVTGKFALQLNYNNKEQVVSAEQRDEEVSTVKEMKS